MPEIPDLNVFARTLNTQFKGKKILRTTLKGSRRTNITSTQLSKAAKGASLLLVHRDGKELLFELDNEKTIAVHLMLHGEFRLFEKKNEHKFAIAEFYFENDKGLAITDWQKSARISINPEKSSVPDVTSKTINKKLLASILDSKKSIKTVLTDQSKLRGLGNAYVDEILYEARISPLSSANKVPGEKIPVLLRSIKKILQWGEKNIIKSSPSHLTGEIRDFLKVHNARKKTSPAGFTIRKKMIDGKKTYYTSEQFLYR